MTLVTRIPLIVADFAVLALTWMKTYAQIQSARRLRTSAPIVACLARDGTVYFVYVFGLVSNAFTQGFICSALLVMNIVQMLLGSSLVVSGPEARYPALCSRPDYLYAERAFYRELHSGFSRRHHYPPVIG